MKDMAKSIEMRLKNIARRELLPYEMLLRFHMQSGILLRISKSQYKDNFILKGGLLTFILMRMKSRPTLDIDLLAIKLKNELKNIEAIFTEIFSVDFDGDGLHFDIQTMTIQKIMVHSGYPGVQLKITCYLGQNTNIHMHIDIGFGDIVINPSILEYPPMLSELETIILKAYSIDSLIAEKFHAMVRHSVFNGRLKDFYDVHSFLSTREFDGEILQNAIRQTFAQRNTDISDAVYIFTSEYAENDSLNKQWGIFKRRLGQAVGQSFPEIMTDIGIFLKPILNSLIEDEQFASTWNPDVRVWRR